MSPRLCHRDRGLGGVRALLGGLEGLPRARERRCLVLAERGAPAPGEQAEVACHRLGDPMG